MAWFSITEDDVQAALSGPELAAYRQKAGTASGGDDDKLQTVIDQVTNMIRAHIEDCPENRLGMASASIGDRTSDVHEKGQTRGCPHGKNFQNF